MGETQSTNSEYRTPYFSTIALFDNQDLDRNKLQKKKCIKITFVNLRLIIQFDRIEKNGHT